MKLSLKMGNGFQNIVIPDENLLDVLLPNDLPSIPQEEAEIRRAMAHPIQSLRLRQIVSPGEKIAIVTSDVTRPMPTAIVMPFLLDELYEAGISARDITLVFALGSHRPHTPDEQRRLAGERAFKEIRLVDSDPSDCVHLGVTSYDTPVDITRVVAEADRRICLGNIEYHYFAGYSGGAKALMPGVSTRAAIQANHSRMVDPKARAGNLTDNPLRADIEEAGAICGIDFILNVVLDEHKQIIHACAGDAIAAHREGCRFLDTLYLKPIQEQADIVIVSPGGIPKDLNLYQAQKALDNAKHAIKAGGSILLLGSCKEGLGEKTFEEWMTQAKQPEELITRIQQNFQLGGHKAAAIAMVLKRAKISLISDLEADLVSSLFLKPYPSLQEAFDAAMEKHGANATVLVMPYGGSTLPKPLTVTP